MHFVELYQQFHGLINILIGAFGGGFLVRAIQYLINRGKDKVRVDSRISSLEETSQNLTQSIEENHQQLQAIKEIAKQNAKQQTAIQEQIKQLQEYKEDTKDNTKAIQTLSVRLENFIEVIESLEE